MSFTKTRKNLYTTDTLLDNNSMQWEQKLKYLGIMLDKKMKFKDHISYVLNKVNILTRTLYPFINRKSSLNIANKKNYFKVHCATKYTKFNTPY